MFRLIRTVRLQVLEAWVESLKAERDSIRQTLTAERRERALVEQARDFYKQDAAEWKGRACRITDQLGNLSGILQGPAMSQPETPAPDTARTLFSALNRSETTRPSPETAPTTGPQILGVNEEAARSAVAFVRTTS